MVLETGHEWLEIMQRDVGHKLAGTKPIAAQVTTRGHAHGDVHSRRASCILGSEGIAHDR